MSLSGIGMVGLLILALVPEPPENHQAMKFADCPPAVRKALEDQARGAKIETVSLEKNDQGDPTYWAEAELGGRAYAIGVLQNGTLVEMNLAVDDDDLALEKCPTAVQTTFRTEAFGSKIETVGRDIKYGVTIFEAVVVHNGKSYEVVVAEDGTLVEKVLVIDDDEVEIGQCPAPVQTALRENAKGGKLGGEITRSTGIGRRTYEVEVEVKGKVYLIEVDETGLLLSKSLEAENE